ncbi:hypothetical protein [Caballeronia sp. GACF4]|uniref:hypothetical protein n=1 Tax=Caballeronia sp. GACF4 TaxID=2921763 RepID=UPI00202824E3|nr:hypothetical protein [Caballeronia sp. GACF4]
MRSFFAADDALPRVVPALFVRADGANERRLMTDEVAHFDHLRRCWRLDDFDKVARRA